ncbi:MAG: hypothetical protein Q4C70_04290 [Planctomycetia bacterium]|nr:hypothetical protein [Planctomycetia bacterium]
MEHKYLYVDGEMSTTGIRDAVDGDFVFLDELNLSESLKSRITSWLKEYNAHDLPKYEGSPIIDQLDEQGIKIAKLLQLELPEHIIVRYHSAVNMTSVYFWDGTNFIN